MLTPPHPTQPNPTPQAHQQEWLHGSWDALDGEVVEKDVATAHKTVYKAGRAFNNRGATQLAANCDAVRANIEEFRNMVPLVQVGGLQRAPAAAAVAETVPALASQQLHPWCCIFTLLV